jgi:lauroyl/myristoyl acyltransferase
MKAFAIRAATFLLRFRAVVPARAIAWGLGDLCWIVCATRRRVIRQNLAHLVPEAGRTEHRRLARATFRNFALCTLDFLKLPLLQKDDLEDLVEVRGREHLERALAARRGVILVTAHLGNLDLAAACLGALGLGAFSVMEDLEPKSLAAVYKRLGRPRGCLRLSSAQARRGPRPRV